MRSNQRGQETGAQFSPTGYKNFILSLLFMSVILFVLHVHVP